MTAKRETLLTFALLLLVLAFDHWAFQALGSDYLRWYLDNGFFIGLLTALFAIAWGELDKNVGLISPHPRAYVAASLVLVSLPAKVLFGQAGAVVGGLSEHFADLKSGSRKLEAEDWWLALEMILAWPAVLLFTGALILWLITVVPIQYFTFFLCGSIPRLLWRASDRHIATSHSSGWQVKTIHKEDPVPDGWWDTSFSRKPVTLTALFSSLFLLLLDTFVMKARL